MSISEDIRSKISQIPLLLQNSYQLILLDIAEQLATSTHDANLRNKSNIRIHVHTIKFLFILDMNLHLFHSFVRIYQF